MAVAEVGPYEVGYEYSPGEPGDRWYPGERASVRIYALDRMGCPIIGFRRRYPKLMRRIEDRLWQQIEERRHGT